MRAPACAPLLLGLVLLPATNVAGSLQFRPRPVTLSQARQVITSVRDDLVDILWWQAPIVGDQGTFKDVVKVCDLVVRLDPTFIEPHATGAWLTWNENDTPGAIARYRAGIAANPNHWQLYHELGLLYMRAVHDPAAALPYLKRAVELPSPMFARHSYAHCLEKLGRKAEALAVWKEVLKACPTDLVAPGRIARLSAER